MRTHTQPASRGRLHVRLVVDVGSCLPMWLCATNDDDYNSGSTMLLDVILGPLLRIPRRLIHGKAPKLRELEDLPPLPRPDAGRWGESLYGIVTILTLTALLLGFPHAMALSQAVAIDGPPCELGSIGTCNLLGLLLGCLWIEAAMTLIALFGVLCADPGVLKRSPQRCFPVPPPVRDALRHGESVPSSMPNYLSGKGHTYCVRCCVWRHQPAHLRPASPSTDRDSQGTRYATAVPLPLWADEEVVHDVNVHHCSTCQRCVAHFDHHCTFLGRCIAGEGFGGNMGFFKLLLFSGASGLLTSMGAVFAITGPPPQVLLNAAAIVVLAIGFCCACGCCTCTTSRQMPGEMPLI